MHNDVGQRMDLRRFLTFARARTSPGAWLEGYLHCLPNMRRLSTGSSVRPNGTERPVLALLHDFDRPIFLIVDGGSVHKAKKVKVFVAGTKGGLELFFLPPYSPGAMNPDE